MRFSRKEDGYYAGEKQIILIANGSFNDLDFYRGQIKDGDYVICADGGAKYALLLGITPFGNR